MADKGWVHINGTTYETSEVTDADSGARLLERLTGSGRQQLNVVRDGQGTVLAVYPERLWSVAAWFGSDGGAKVWW